jgi:L-serine deaminase
MPLRSAAADPKTFGQLRHCYRCVNRLLHDQKRAFHEVVLGCQLQKQAGLRPLANCIETMRQTGLDMSQRYKESSTGGIAVNLPEC